MAKAKSAVDPLLAGLKRALDAVPDLLPLVGAKGKALFATPDAEVAERAVAEGYLTKREVTAPAAKGKKKATVYGIITESGARKVAEAGEDGSVKAVLESLLGAVQKLPAPVAAHPPADPGAIRDLIREATPPVVSAVEQSTRSAMDAVTATVEKLAQSAVNSVAAAIEKALGDVRKLLDTIPTQVEQTVKKAVPGGMTPGVKAALGELQQKVTDALPAQTTTPPTATDPAPVLAALRTALDRLKTEPPVAKIPVMNDHPTASVAPAPSVRQNSGAAISDEIVAFVEAVARERTVGCDFAELYDHLRSKHPNLTIGTFHDALRALDDAGRIRLRDWPRLLDDMPRPELAFFVSHTVMYHVQPAR